MNDFIPAKKSLGQNWLISISALDKIITTSKLKAGETVLEIGPGKGALTEKLLQSKVKVIAIEKDHRLIEFLQAKFADEIASGQLILLETDVLDLADNFLQTLGDYKLIANIPYYITGELFRKFFETPYQPKQMVVLVQKEVADRITNNKNKESILSISVKVYGEPKMISKVPRGAFRPVPNVDSAILSIENINRDFFGDLNEQTFFKLIKKGFGQKRKLLKSNLETTDEVFTECDIPKNSRAEDLKLTDWKKLVSVLNLD